jgi:protein-S-isoprenylcysteine O-methyltransferase Ste14
VIAVINFHKIGTNVPPYLPSLKLATQGIYAYTRNPIYEGFFFLIAGVEVCAASIWILILLLPYSLIMHYGIILREERYLENKFGADYRQYKSNTPRYGWKF